MLLRLAALGAIGYAAYKYYGNHRAPIGGAADGSVADAEDYAGPAGGPLSRDASLVHAGEGPVG